MHLKEKECYCGAVRQWQSNCVGGAAIENFVRTARVRVREREQEISFKKGRKDLTVLYLLKKNKNKHYNKIPTQKKGEGGLLRVCCMHTEEY